MNNARLYESIAVFVYVAAIAVIGLLSSRRGRGGSATEYFLADRDLRWVTIGASLFVTTTWAVLLAVLSHPLLLESGLLIITAVASALLLSFLALKGVPLYGSAQVHTVPQHWVERYDGTTSLWLSVASILFQLCVRIPLTIIAGSWLFQAVLGWDLLSSSMLMIVVSGLYTVAGGFGAVVSAHVLQSVVALAGLVGLATVGFPAIVLPGVLGSAQESMGSFLIGAAVIGGWSVTADQFVIQRLLGGRNRREMRGGSLLAASLMLLVALIGLVTLQPLGEVRQTSLGSSPLLAGLVGVAFLSLLMSSLAASLHSTSTLFTMDLYRRLRPDATDARLVLVGRLATTVVVILSILVASSTALVDARVFAVILDLPSSIVPPVLSVVLFGMFIKWTNARGAFWSLAVGMALGTLRIIARLSGADVAPWGEEIPFSAVLFVISSVVLIVVSLLGPEAKPDVAPAKLDASQREALGRSVAR